MRKLLLTSSMLLAFSAPAFAASFNDINIDASGSVGDTGAVKSLSITQDDGGSANTVSQDGTTSGAANALPVRGSWKSVTVTQTGSNNVLKGGVKTSSNTAATNATLTASYTGNSHGGNVHSLNVGQTAAPADPAISISVANTATTGAAGGVNDNVINDTLDGTGLNYTLAVTGYGNGIGNTVASSGGAVGINLGVTGNGNTVANNVSASGAVALNQGGAGFGVYGDGNSVTNNVAGVSTFTHNLSVGAAGTGASNNTIVNTANTAAGITDLSITQNVQTGAAANNIQQNFTANASGTQNAVLNVTGTSQVNYLSNADGASQSTNISLDNVSGASGAAGVVVTQTSAAGGATANVSISGGAYTAGTLGAIGAGLPGAGLTPSVYVYQNSSGATLNAMVTAAATGYTVKFAQ